MPYGNFYGGEDFVLGQRSAFGKATAKDFAKSTKLERQMALSSFMRSQGEEEQKKEKKFNQGIKNARALEGLKAAPYQAKALGGIHKGAKEPTGGSSLKDIAVLAKDYPELMNTMILAGIIQSPTKLVGWTAEQATGDPNTGNRISQAVLDEITSKRTGRSGGMRGYRPEMTEEQKRLESNRFYSEQLKGNEERALAKEMLAPEFTSDTTYGDVIDTGSWFTPGTFAKGLRAGLKGARSALAATKAANYGGRTGRLALGGAAGLGTAGVYAEQPDEASAAWNLAKPASYAGKKMEGIIGKSMGEFTPDDVARLLREYPQTILGRSDRAASDTNYNRQRIMREAFNEMLNATGQTGDKRGYSSWFKSLPKSKQDKILNEGRRISDEELSKLGMDALNEYTTIVNGKRVWKEGGREAMFGKHDLGHKTFGSERGTKEHELFFQPSKQNLSAASIFMRK